MENVQIVGRFYRLARGSNFTGAVESMASTATRDRAGPVIMNQLDKRCPDMTGMGSTLPMGAGSVRPVAVRITRAAVTKR